MSLSSKINYAFEALSGITVGNINITGNIFQNNNPYIASQWTSTTGNALSYTSGSVIISNGSLVASNLTAGNINFTGTLSQNGSPYIGSQWTGTSGTLYYGTAGSSVVGINTSSPSYTLDVNGTLEASNANGIFLFASSGNVGVGTSSPSAKLDVSGTGRITTSLTTGALYSTNQTTTNIVGTSATITNLNIPGTLTVVNITSTNLVDSNISATNLRVTGTTSVANIYSSLGTISNLVNTNLSTNTLAVSDNIVSSRINIGGTQPIYNSNTLGKLFITGAQNSVTAGPNILITTSQDTFPTYNLLTYGHDASWSMYDMYYDGSFRNSSTSTAFMMVKESSTLRWNYNTSGFSAGAVAPVATSICIGSSGNIGLGGQLTPAYTLDVSGGARISTGITAGSSRFTSVSAGNSQFTGLSAGNINFTGSLFQNGSPYIGSQWVGTSGNIYFGTTGSSVVGINTTSPVTTLDVSGTGRITTSLTTGALYSTNQTTTNIVGTSITASNVKVIGSTTAVNSSTGSVVLQGGLAINEPTNATSVSNGGALTIAGGAAIEGDLIVGGSILYSNAQAASSTFSYLTLTATDWSTDIANGALVSFGGISVQTTANAFSATEGNGLTVAGGAGIGADLYVDGTSYLPNIVSTDISTSIINTDGILPVQTRVAGNTGLSLFTFTGDGTEDNYIRIYGEGTTGSSNVEFARYGWIANRGMYTMNIGKSGAGIVKPFVLEVGTNLNQLFLSTSGSIGIGTTSPLNTLHVSGTARITTSLTTGALYSTNQTTTNIVATASTITNLSIPGTLTVVNITSTNLVDTTISAGTIVATTTSTANVYGSLGTISNLVGTTISSENLVGSSLTSGNSHITGTLNTYDTVTINKSGVGAELLALVFNTERAWVIKQTGSGPSTNLVLQSQVNAKNFFIQSHNGSNIAQFYDGGANGILYTSIGNLYSGIITTGTLLNTNIISNTITTSNIILTGGSLNATFNSNTIGSIFTTGGNVGIGTSSPSLALDVFANTTSGHLGMRLPNSGNHIYFMHNGGTAFMRAGGADFGLGFEVGGLGTGTYGGQTYNRIMTLLSTGNVGINTTTAAFTLDVNGTIDASTYITSAALYSTNQTTTNIVATASTITNLSIPGTLTVVNITSTNLVETNITTTSIIVTGGSLNATFNSNTIGSIFTTGGNVGINTTNPLQALDVYGSISLSGGKMLSGITREYPPTSMTGNSTIITNSSYEEDNGTYIASASSIGVSFGQPSYAFDKSDSSFWHAGYGTYDDVTGAYIGNISTIVDSNTYNGEWLQIQFPRAITIWYFTLLPRSGLSASTRGPSSFVIAGSNNGTDWSLLYNVSNVYWEFSRQLFNITTPGEYQYYRIITTVSGNPDVVSGRSSVQIGEWQLFSSKTSVLTNVIVSGDANTIGNIFTTGGNVGINTTSPGFNLDVNGTINANDSLSIGGGISSFFAGSFSANNNVTSASNITGLLFPSATIRSFVATLTINVSRGGGNLNEMVTLEGVQRDSGWVLFDSSLGEDTGLVFTIDSTGQLQYTSPNYIGWVSTTIRFEGHYYSISGTYTPVTLPTTGNVSITGDLSVSSTNNATNTSSGALTVSGGAGISKSLLVGENFNLGGVSNTFTGSFGAANNVSSATNVTGFLVPTATFSSFTATVNVRMLTTTTILNAQYLFEATQTTSGWLLNDTTLGDSVGITFTITSGGQIQYTSTNMANWQATTINYSVTAISISTGFTAVLPTSGSVSISGNLTIDDTTDSSSTSSASLVLAGGVGINKSLLVGGNFNIGGVTTQFAGTFSAANGVSGATFTGLSFPNATIRSFTCTISIRVVSSTNYNTQHTIDGIQTATGGWQISDSQIGDASGITFAIDSNGQITYTSPTFTSWTSTTMHYNAVVYNISSSYTPIPMPTGGSSSVAGSLVIQGTDEASSTSSGSLSVSGGVNVQKNLIVANNFFVTSAGNVGIGTTAPAHKLDVVGTIDATTYTGSNIMVSGSIGSLGSIDAGSQFLGQPNDNATAPSFSWTGDTNTGMYRPLADTLGFVTNGVERMRVTTGGNVGIGTSSPSHNLEIIGDLGINKGMRLLRSGVFNYIQSGTSTGTASSADLRFTDIFANSTYMTIRTSGNVGIGTTFPTVKLDVVGAIRAVSGTTASVLINEDGGVNGNIEIYGTSGGYIDFKNNSGDDYDARIQLLGSNNSLNFYSMNTTTGMSLTSAGTLLISGDIGAFASISDARLKTNVENITPEIALDTVKTLRPVTFNWKDDIFNQARRGEFDSGFIAQEVEEVIPHAVGEYTTIDYQNTYKNMRHERIIPYLVGSIQKLEGIITELREKVAYLESK